MNKVKPVPLMPRDIANDVFRDALVMAVWMAKVAGIDRTAFEWALSEEWAKPDARVVEIKTLVYSGETFDRIARRLGV